MRAPSPSAVTGQLQVTQVPALLQCLRAAGACRGAEQPCASKQDSGARLEQLPEPPAAGGDGFGEHPACELLLGCGQRAVSSAERAPCRQAACWRAAGLERGHLMLGLCDRQQDVLSLQTRGPGSVTLPRAAPMRCGTPRHRAWCGSSWQGVKPQRQRGSVAAMPAGFSCAGSRQDAPGLSPGCH